MLQSLLLLAFPTAAQSFSGSGSGTMSDPYLIYNPVHLNEVHNFIGQEGVVFKMMQDVDLTSWLADNNPTNGWLPIGTEAQPFSGTFLGNGKEIKGVHINRSSMARVGFFGSTNNATINNLTIQGFTTKGGEYVGSFVGYMKGGTANNISVTMNVEGTYYVGGLCGLIEGGELQNFSHSGSISSSGKYTGGVVSWFDGTTISSGTHIGDISGTEYVGGIAGGGDGTSSIQGVTVTANVTATGDYSGLCVGCTNLSSRLTINNVSSKGNLNGQSNTGGVIGDVHGYLSVSNSKVYGDIIGDRRIGGIAGINYRSISANAVFHDGKITASGDYVGGFVGQTSLSYTIEGCGHIGNVTSGGNYVSGGIGSATMSSDKYYLTNLQEPESLIIPVKLENCYSVGDVISAGIYVGGLMGSANARRITRYWRCLLSDYDLYTTFKSSSTWNASNAVYKYIINGNTYYSKKNYTEADFPGLTFSSEGLFHGTLSDKATSTIDTQYILSDSKYCPTISNSYFSGDITGVDYVGGLVGGCSDANISTSYSSGKIRANQNVGGIVGFADKSDGPTSANISSCVAANEVIVGVSGNTGRIYGAIGDGVSVGTTGTTSANKGLVTAKVTSAGSTVVLDDCPQHGTNVGASTLRTKANYVGMGWNFDDYWKIQETECFPYKVSQCAPPKITSQLISGATSVLGQSIDGGTVILFTGNGSYTSTVSGNQWTINIPEGLQSGDIVKVCATKTGLMQSYYTTGIVGFAGSGTEEDPYLIYTANDLANINSYSYYKIMNDIDVSSWIASNSPTTGWIPIGMNSGVSMKQLDGNGKTISGFWTNSTTNYYGLISTTNEAIIKDLTINLSRNSKVGSNSAILVGKSENTTFTNIVVSGNINGGDYLGGVVGYGQSNTFENCRVESTITSSGWTGGISGYSVSGNYSNCSYNGTITGLENVGGISGGNNTTNSFTLCQVSGSITGTRYVGGITPSCSRTINMCKVDATVVGKDFVGGIVGSNSTSSSLITETYSKGTVTATATESNNCYAGGIAGQNQGVIRNSYTTAEVTSAEYGAGIVGVNTGTIDKCYASGNVTAEKWGAGIAGYNEGSGATVTNCFAANNKIIVSEAGGIGMRMIGGFRNGASEPDRSNYALNTMVVSVNNVTKIVYDDPLEGTAIDNAALMSATTYTAQGWDFTEVWGIEEGQGYPYLQALVEEPDFMLGDVNGDSKINVSDYIATARYILEQNPQPFVVAAADFDGNGDITVGDLIHVATMVLTYEAAPRQIAAAPHHGGNVAMNANVTAIGNNRYEVALTLDNDVDLTALQLDLQLPAGMTMTGATLGDRATSSHELNYVVRANGSYRLLAASAACKAFIGSEGTMLTLILDGRANGIATMSGIELATPRGESYRLDDLSLDFSTTGISKLASDCSIFAQGGNIVIVSPCAGMVQIVLPNGKYTMVRVEPGRNVFSAPATGVVIVKANNNAVKLKF